MGFAKTNIVEGASDVASDSFLQIENLTLISASITPNPITATFAEVWAQIFVVSRNGEQIIDQTLLTQGYVDVANSISWTGRLEAGPITEVMGRIRTASNFEGSLATLTLNPN